MVHGVIKADDRHTIRRMRTAMQGNVIRALVELITNADDSYIRLDTEGIPHDGTVEILYEKVSYRGIFAVRDHAAGMSADDLQEYFTRYGAATSGMKGGEKVRGYFGQGGKDALVSMENGRIVSFRNGQFAECRLFIKEDKPWYDISDSVPADEKLRSMHGIEGNGTVASFEASRRVPRVTRVQEELANNYLLRKIMMNPNRKVFLLDAQGGKKRRLRYQMPKGKEILVDRFVIPYGSYGDFLVQLSIWRADKELTQTGDDRHGGLLLVDEEDTVLGISLFKYDNEPFAARFFGEVKIGGFRQLLSSEEPVLKEDRSGLEARHPFCEILIREIEARVDKKVKDERLRKQKEDQSRIDAEGRRRYRKALRIFNEIAEVEAQAVINLGPEVTNEAEEPPNGFCLYPLSAQITVGKRYVFQLRLNTDVVRYGSIVKVSCSHQKIRVLTPEIRISSSDGSGILRKYITVEGTEPNVKGTLRAISGNRSSEATIDVIPEKELLLAEGMAFQPETLTLRPNKPRRVHLLVYVKMIRSGSKIEITSENESVHVSRQEIVVNEADAIRHIAKYELEIWGEGAGEDALVTAEHDIYMALLDTRVRAKQEPEDKSRKGMFNEPEWNYDADPLQRTSYSTETGQVIIYVNFPSVKYYVGDSCQYIKTLPAQVFVADLLAERCFFEIARKKVESGGVVLRPEAIRDRIQRDAQDLSRKYGRKVHEALVDRSLLSESREDAGR